MDAYIAEDPVWRKLPTDETVPPGDGEEWATTKIFAATNYTGDGESTFDGEIATEVSQPTPFMAGGHNYSGPNFPALFSSTSVSWYPTYGWDYGLLNVKCDWNDLASGAMNTHITNFINSIPVGFKVYLVINHEPEGPGPEPDPADRIIWCTGQAVAANLIASIDDPRCEMGICHMSFTWDGTRDPEDYNPATGGTVNMTQAALDRTIFAPDGYTKVRNAAGTDIDTMEVEFGDCFAGGASWGFSRFAISEHALNNDEGAPVNKLVEWWESDHLPWIRTHNLVYYAYYQSSGPASGTNSYLDTPEERQMFGDFITEYKYG